MITFEHEVDLDEIAERIAEEEDYDSVVKFVKYIDELFSDTNFTMDLVTELVKIIIEDGDTENISDLKELLANTDKDKKIKELEEELKHLRGGANKCS